MHAIVRNSIGAPVESPCAFLQVLWFFRDNDADAGWTSVQNNAFNHFFTPRAGAGNQHDVTMAEPMNWQTGALTVFKHKNRFTEKTTLSSTIEIE